MSAAFRSVWAAQEQMIEAVICDFGGVLTCSPFEAFARNYSST
jgi:hypothetical protein